MRPKIPGFTLKGYLHDHVLAFFLIVLSVALTSLILVCFGLSASGVLVIEGTFVLACAVALIHDYLRRLRYWEAVSDALQAMSHAAHINEMMPEPTFADARIASGVIGALSCAYNAELGQMRAECDDYRRYIELWVHEVKAPIAAASLIAARIPDASEILPELERMEREVANALFYARATSTTFDYQIRATELAPAAREAVRTHARFLIQRGVSVSFDIDAALTAQTDKQWLVFMLGQVLLNSAQYGAQHVHMSASWTEKVHSVVLAVADDGEGIPAHDMPSVFERSYVGENGRAYGKSTGMGLYLVALMCDRCGIGVSLTSEEGVGTTVSFEFPQDLARRSVHDKSVRQA